MKMFCGLIWTLFQVCWALKGPGTVTAPLGGSVSVHCNYKKGDEKFVKFWCKEVSPKFCSSKVTIRTTGTEAEVEWKRGSIKDDQTLCKIIVTMENLTKEDSGIYLCGIERNYDIWHPVEVVVTTDFVDEVTIQKPEWEDQGGFTEAPESIQPNNTDFLLLIIIKIPIIFMMVVGLVWMHIWYRRTPRRSNDKVPGS